MGRFKGKDLYLKNDDQIYFGDNQEAALWYDDSDLQVNHTISGVAATQPYHLVQKQYVDGQIATVSGGEAGPPGFGVFATARVDADGTVRDSFNLNVSRSATGTYGCTFTSRPKDAYYSVIAQPYQTVTDTNAMVSSVSTTGFTIQVGQGDNGSSPDVLTDTDFSVVVVNSEGSTTAASGVGYLCACQIRRTTDYTYTTSWANVTFDTTDVENTTIITHDGTNTERINIGATGLYMISYDMKAHLATGSTNNIVQASGRVLINGTTVAPGSSLFANVYVSETHDVDCTAIVYLTAGDYIVFQAMKGTTDAMTAPADTVFNIVKLDGVKGDKGDKGAPGADGADGIDGVVTVSGSATGYFDAYDSSGGTTVGTTWVDIPLITERYKSTGLFAHSASSPEVIIQESYTYIINARVTTAITAGSTRTDSIMRIVKDSGSGYVEIPGTRAKMYNRTLNLGENTGNVTIVSGLNKNDRIKVQAIRDNGSSTLALEANGSSLSIFTTTGEKGDPGADGAPGSGSNLSLKHEGTTVTGSPFSILNFTGSSVNKVEDQGGGQAEIYIEPDFGSWYGWSFSDSESNTNSTSWVNKVTYTSPSVPAGYYRVGYQFEWRRNSASNDFKARIQIDNTNTIMEMNEESKDINSWHHVGGFVIVNLTNASHTIDIDFSGENTGSTSYIRRARIEFWMINSS